MNEETLGMLVGFIFVAPIAAYFFYKILKKRMLKKNTEITNEE